MQILKNAHLANKKQFISYKEWNIMHNDQAQNFIFTIIFITDTINLSMSLTN
jgi:hypothetical protein